MIAEVQKQMSDLEVKQKEKVEELNSEIRKLKAMIVKHETRIRYHCWPQYYGTEMLVIPCAHIIRAK